MEGDKEQVIAVESAANEGGNEDPHIPNHIGGENEVHEEEPEATESEAGGGAGDRAKLNLNTIPIEVLLQIFNFVDATDLLRNVSLVSKYFYDILSNELTWKIKMERRWGGVGKKMYPPLELLPDFEGDTVNSTTASPTGNKSLSPEPCSLSEVYSTSFTQSTFPWSRASVKREEQIKLWSKSDAMSQTNGLVQATINSHVGCIDSIHLFQKNDTMLLACGSRDRTISLWNVEQVLQGSRDGKSFRGATPAARIKIFDRAHNGWIWDFGVNSNHLFSCSWDTSAKIWDLAEMKCVGTFKSTTALLSISSTDTLTAIGSFNKKILLLDPRALSAGPTKTYTAHTRSVLSVGLDSNYVISCGEDGSCVQYDLRGDGVVKSLKLERKSEAPKSPYPTCMSFRDTKINLPYFYVGDNAGSLHLVDLLKFKVVNSYHLHSSPVRGVFHNLGSVLSCSRNGKLLVRDPSLEMREIGAVDVGDKIELPCVHSLNNVVACGGGDGVVRVWGECVGENN